jgi:Tol biopolymer transport system component
MLSTFRIFLFLIATSVVAGCADDNYGRGPTAPRVSTPNADQSNAGKKDNESKWGPWSAPINLGAVVNSADSDSHPAISKNGLTLYFSSHRAGSTDIWVSHRLDVDQPWQPPAVLGAAINTPAFELAPNLSLDGRTLYFHRNPGPCGGADIFVSHRQNPDDDTGWETAMALPCNSVNSALSDAGPTIFEDRRMHTTVLYFTRQNTPGPNGFDILVDTLQSDGRWGVASVVPELTSPVRDTRTTISRDGLEMFISSGRVGGFGSEDIWISTRASTTDVWSTPVNAGGIINGSAFDGAPALSFDGRSLYFFSERTGPDANGVMPLGLRDLYVSTRTRLGDDSTDLPASGFPSNFIIDSSSVIMHGAVSLLEAGSHKGRAPSQELGVCIC